MISDRPLIVRWAVLLALFGALWASVHFVGLYVIPLVTGLDYAISAAVNPDSYVPGLDEFFRAVTDYTNVLIPVPLLSMAIAVGIYKLTLLPAKRALLWSAISCGLWWLVLAYLSSKYKEVPSALALGLGAVAPALILLGAGPPRLLPAIDTKRWLAALLTVDALVFLGLWAGGMLWPNKGLPGANYLFLLGLLACFGGMIYAFQRMDDAALGRFARVFWLVVLSIVMSDFFATHSIKDAIARPRPLNEAHSPWNEALRTVPEERVIGRSSYPSGHTSGTFALLTPLFWWSRDRRVRAGLLTWGVLQGASRVYTVAHFASDCIMGGLLGFGTGTLIFFLLGGPKLRTPQNSGAPAACCT
jgi:membrane-associated phospholipid phosphatase